MRVLLKVHEVRLRSGKASRKLPFLLLLVVADV